MVKHPDNIFYFFNKKSPTSDQNNSTSIEQPVQNTEDLLPREPCLQALAALRHAKWFQVCYFSLKQ
jgi:hypothetical protein